MRRRSSLVSAIASGLITGDPAAVLAHALWTEQASGIAAEQVGGPSKTFIDMKADSSTIYLFEKK